MASACRAYLVLGLEAPPQLAGALSALAGGARQAGNADPDHQARAPLASCTTRELLVLEQEVRWFADQAISQNTMSPSVMLS